MYSGDEIGTDEQDGDDETFYSGHSAMIQTANSGLNKCLTSPAQGLLSSLPKELELRPTAGSLSGTLPQLYLSIWSRSDLKAGTLFGPYGGKIRKDPIPSSFNWKVSKGKTKIALFPGNKKWKVNR